ncbi:MAG TPA: hypothetical protein VFA63_17815 [Pseudonocardiaceae bacterium]|jgi:hypothetical protein|nr:hypothetical protein [Pseudonocardiaceae bacterium]
MTFLTAVAALVYEGEEAAMTHLDTDARGLPGGAVPGAEVTVDGACRRQVILS